MTSNYVRKIIKKTLIFFGVIILKVSPDILCKYHLLMLLAKKVTIIQNIFFYDFYDDITYIKIIMTDICFYIYFKL